MIWFFHSWTGIFFFFSQLACDLVFFTVACDLAVGLGFGFFFTVGLGFVFFTVGLGFDCFKVGLGFRFFLLDWDSDIFIVSPRIFVFFLLTGI